MPMLLSLSIIHLVAKGELRQEAHEQIDVLSYEAGSVIKNEGKPNDLVDRIKKNEFFKLILGELDGILKVEL